jgi:hypothetical protein
MRPPAPGRGSSALRGKTNRRRKLPSPLPGPVAWFRGKQPGERTSPRPRSMLSSALRGRGAPGRERQRQVHVWTGTGSAVGKGNSPGCLRAKGAARQTARNPPSRHRNRWASDWATIAWRPKKWRPDEISGFRPGEWLGADPSNVPAIGTLARTKRQTASNRPGECTGSDRNPGRN